MELDTPLNEDIEARNPDDLVGIISWSTILSVAHLLKSGNPTNDDLADLEQFLNAFLLYDRLYYFDAHPGLIRVFAEREQKYSFLTDLEQMSPGVLFHKFPFDSWNEGFEILKDLAHPHFTASFLRTSALECPLPLVAMKEDVTEEIRDAITSRITLDGMDIHYPHLVSEDQNLFLRYFYGRIKWYVETAQEMVQKHNASGSIYPPFAREYMQIAWKEYSQNAISAKVSEFQAALIRQSVPPGFDMNFTPLLTILLDTCPSIDKLAETMVQMRGDYKDIRTIARKYNYALDEANSYGEIKHIHSEWQSQWEAIIAQIGKTRKSLPQRLFSWEAIGGLSAKSWLGKAAGMAIHDLGERKLRKVMSVMSNLETEFLSSRTLDKSIRRLFS